ncbi:MAG TPA: PilZ domain-containing protein [Bacteroidetes bacterium]|nr:PilZ domain protein [bacterium BMS3Bbin04]HDO64616.1 PilZ domain-containing protein [Bacteroidota bacterium]HEX03741.1 PilZ domain-containing protein [Bacteroidota bacterium]
MSRLEESLSYFQNPELHIWAVIAVIVLFGFLLTSFILAFREYLMYKKAKRIVRKHYTSPTGQTTRRRTPRLLVRIPARVMVENSKNVVEAEVLDVSAGGIRLLLFHAPRLLRHGESLDLITRDPLFVNMQRMRVEIVRVRSGPRSDTPTIHGKWQGLPVETSRSLSREIRRRLLHES